MLHIGLTQRVEFIPGRDECRDCLDQVWARWVLDAGHIPVPLPNQPAHAELLLDEFEIDALILTGGNDLAELPDATNVAPMRDAFERRLLDLASGRGLPVLGVCRGMQMIVQHYGGQLVHVDGHVLRSHPIIPRGYSMPTLPRAEVNSYHAFGTRPALLSDNLAVAGLAPDGTVEAVVHKDRPQWAIMWHPERPIRADTTHLEARDTGILRALLEKARA